MIITMIVLAVVVVALGLALAAYLLTRRSPARAASTRADFDEAFDELVAGGERVEGDREAAWREFVGSQEASEKERLSWEEATDD